MKQLLILMVLLLVGCSEEPQLACRNGKAYEVIAHGNIVLYSPTYDDCEEIR